MSDLDDFVGPNAGYVIELYQRYRDDPNQVDEASRAIFDRWAPVGEDMETAVGVDLMKVTHVANLVWAIRSYGHLEAQLDPLGEPPRGDPEIELDFYGLEEGDLRRIPASVVGGAVAQNARHAWEAIQALREIYCNKIGYDYGHIHLPEERGWLRESAEIGRFRSVDEDVESRKLLERLTQVETFELFLHRFFPGKTRFSIEGVDMLVPMLDELLRAALEENICMIILGMSHRGRLNVLAHVLQKPYAQILAEFRDPRINFTNRDELGWLGDVKYHKGGYRDVEGSEVVQLIINMPPNPSHLENINPVVEGMARAADSGVEKAGPPQFFPNAVLPLLIHGDASFSGEGVVSESLNFSSLPGYQTGGTVHIIANNQLGYTATEKELRSTLFASDLTKGFEIPVIHVNGDDPQACLEAVRTAFAYRSKFHKDFVVDLIGYRRYGHNEGDEPSFTQPLMYAKIRKHPSLRAQLARELEAKGLIEEGYADRLVQEKMEELQAIQKSLQPEEAISQPDLELPPPGAAQHVDTRVSLEVLQALNHALLDLPEGFHLHRKLTGAMEKRRVAFSNPSERSVDWATAEELALASILMEGIPIRMSGKDTERGTFSQRHAVFHDVETGETFIPLQSIPQAKASFEIHNSPLTENAVLGFEFGYNIQAPERLVIWEAQYGDFLNIAQIMLDEFVVSARAKWELTPSMVMLLPHGNEGKGPDHSSARLERILQMAAEVNLRLAQPTTAVQYFHLLRRQAALLLEDPLPLFVLTPKGLLRHPLTASSPEELVSGKWLPVIDDRERRGNAKKVKQIVLCSGRIYVDLMTSSYRKESDQIAILRLEQIYPFPKKELTELLENYPRLEEVVWVQEEPHNFGAWTYLQPQLNDLGKDRWPLHFIGREPGSSPAEGSSAWYEVSQTTLVKQVFEAEGAKLTNGIVVERG
jgi:2-oxoglutarate dehydrogenase E1 component